MRILRDYRALPPAPGPEKRPPAAPFRPGTPKVLSRIVFRGWASGRRPTTSQGGTTEFTGTAEAKPFELLLRSSVWVVVRIPRPDDGRPRLLVFRDNDLARGLNQFGHLAHLSVAIDEEKHSFLIVAGGKSSWVSFRRAIKFALRLRVLNILGKAPLQENHRINRLLDGSKRSRILVSVESAPL